MFSIQRTVRPQSIELSQSIPVMQSHRNPARASRCRGWGRQPGGQVRARSSLHKELSHVKGIIFVDPAIPKDNQVEEGTPVRV